MRLRARLYRATCEPGAQLTSVKAHNRPNTGESARCEPIAHIAPMLRRLRDNDSRAQASAPALRASRQTGTDSDASFRLPDPFRLARPVRLAVRAGNRHAESIRRKRPTPV